VKVKIKNEMGIQARAKVHHKGIKESRNQSINQSINQAINQSIKQLSNQLSN
jgi:hypothetical protein